MGVPRRILKIIMPVKTLIPKSIVPNSYILGNSIQHVTGQIPICFKEQFKNTKKMFLELIVFGELELG